MSSDLFKRMMEDVATVNRNNGWYDEDRPFSAEIALFHSEVSEAYEAYREGKLVTRYDKADRPTGIPSEMADILIRLLDTCYRYDIDLYAEYVNKLKYNSGRGYKHGGRKE